MTLDSRPVPGLTLIELLVVIIILTTLVAAAIPLLSPSSSERRLREASRGLNTFITSAQAKAVRLQRPFGIALKRLSQDTGRNVTGDPANDNGVCLEVFFAEQPPPFTGFDETSAVRISLYTPANTSMYGGLRPLVALQFVAQGNANDPGDDFLSQGWDADLVPGVTATDGSRGSKADLPGGVIRPGDVIEVSGTRYRLLADDSDDNVRVHYDATGAFFASNTGKKAIGDAAIATRIVAQPLNNTGQMINAAFDDLGRPLKDIGLNVVSSGDAVNGPFWTYPAPYKILRQPTITSDPPYQLPEGAAIDLRGSGIALELPTTVDSTTDVSGFFHKPRALTNGITNDNSEPIIILFSPEGSVARLRVSNEPIDGQESQYFDGPVTSNLFLLVGDRDAIPADPSGNIADDKTLDISILPSATFTDQDLTEARQKINWLKATSRWVVIGAQSGRVVTSENAFVDVRNWASNSTNYISASLLGRRAMQIDEARTLAREMTRMGGR